MQQIEAPQSVHAENMVQIHKKIYMQAKLRRHKLQTVLWKPIENNYSILY